MAIEKTGNYKKHSTKNPLQWWLVNNFYRKVINLCESSFPERILEAGCGEGFSSYQVISGLKKSAFFGLDLEYKALFQATGRCQSKNFINGTIYSLPFNQNIFDLVICLEVLEHLENPETALEELCRISKKWLILSVPNEPYFCIANFLRGKNLKSFGNDPEHINNWTKNSFLKLVQNFCYINDLSLSFPWVIIRGRVKKTR